MERPQGITLDSPVVFFYLERGYGNEIMDSLLGRGVISVEEGSYSEFIRLV